VGAAIGQILGNAVGVAISPVPIIALILMLFSRAAARNSVAFTVVGLFAVGLVVLLVGADDSSGGESDSGGWAKIIIGVLFLFLALKQWQGRPHDGEEPTMPKWMAAVDELSAVKAIGLGLLLTVANPKNLGLTIAAAASISASGLSDGEQIATLVVFVLLGSLTILVPVAAYLIAAERATPLLNSAKDWLTANSNTVMAVLLLVLGAKVLGDGMTVVF
jgi:threonine/homoserine/homoserine lactone efflux protein